MIDRFEGEYRWLSNFWPAEVKYHDDTYPSVEHAYQAAKFPHWMRESFKSLTAGTAKRYARQNKHLIRRDWDAIKLNVMEDLLRQKFNHPELEALLLATGKQEIVEGNHWNDTFWGVCFGRGHNHLGRLIMKIRAEKQEALP